MDIIDLYRSVAEASERMLAAARTGDWDGLIAAEQECSRRVAVLREHPMANTQMATPALTRDRFDILSEILAHDAEIRELTAPRMKVLEDLIAGGHRARRVGQAYR
jgi:flagellar protein FliT